MAAYTSSAIPDKIYNTTNNPTVFVGLRPAQLLNVASDIRPVMTKNAKLTVRSSQTDNVVPSS